MFAAGGKRRHHDGTSCSRATDLCIADEVMPLVANE
jgi:hypothetical protein